MSKKSVPSQTAEQHAREIRHRTRKQYSSEEKVRIVLSGLRGEHSIAELCRREGIAESMYYAWSKDLLEAGKKRLSGDTESQATSDKVKGLRRSRVVSRLPDGISVSWILGAKKMVVVIAHGARKTIHGS